MNSLLTAPMMLVIIILVLIILSYMYWCHVKYVKSQITNKSPVKKSNEFAHDLEEILSKDIKVTGVTQETLRPAYTNPEAFRGAVRLYKILVITDDEYKKRKEQANQITLP